MARPNTYNSDRTEKRCCTCKLMLPVSNFRTAQRPNTKGVMKTYHRAECRKCTVLRVSRWRKAHLEQTRTARTAYARLWRERNAERYKLYQAEYHRTYQRPVPQPTFADAMALLRRIAQIPAAK